MTAKAVHTFDWPCREGITIPFRPSGRWRDSLLPWRTVISSQWATLGGPNLCLTSHKHLIIFLCCLTGSAYPEWSRGQARRSHSNLVQVPRC